MVYLIYFRSGLILCQYARRWITLRPARRTGFYKKLGKRVVKKIAGEKLYPSLMNEKEILDILVECGHKRENIIRVLGVQLR